MGWTVAVFALNSAACEESRSPAASSKPVAQPTATAAPIATATAQPEVRKKPRKQLEDCPKGPSVAFDNEEVEQAVRFKLQKPKGDVTVADLGRLRSLNLAQVKMQELDICLFAHMKNLRELFLGRGKIEDLSPIGRCKKLESLRASLNPIEDISALSEMTKMDRLDLAHTQIRDLSPLSGMKKLTELLLDSTPVEDVRPLKELTSLQLLVLKDTRVKDVSPLKALEKLKTLDLRGVPADNAHTVMRPGLRVQQF